MGVSTSRAVGVGLALATAALVLVLWPRAPTRPEDLIRQHLLQLARDAEDKDLSSVMTQVSERFAGPEGMGKAELKSFLAAQLFRGTWVRIFTVNLDVGLTGPGAAEVAGKFIFGRSDAKELQQLAKESVMSAYAIDAKLEREADGEWRVVSARYQQIDGRSLY